MTILVTSSGYVCGLSIARHHDNQFNLPFPTFCILCLWSQGSWCLDINTVQYDTHYHTVS